MKYQITFTSASGDNYTGGYWDHAPTSEEVMQTLKECIPDEYEYVAELIEEGSWSDCFWITTAIQDDRAEPEI